MRDLMQAVAAARQASERGMLVIDELGFLDKDSGVVEQVIDARDKARRPTVITSGVNPKELEGRYGTATARKLMGEGHEVVQVFAGVSG